MARVSALSWSVGETTPFGWLWANTSRLLKSPREGIDTPIQTYYDGSTPNRRMSVPPTEEAGFPAHAGIDPLEGSATVVLWRGLRFQHCVMFREKRSNFIGHGK